VQFRKVIDALHAYHDIENPEFTFEAEPGTFSRSKLQWYKDSGVNRLSMGVQSFDDRIIKLSSRKHTASQAIQSIAMVKEAGGFSVNIDLLSGLAGEEDDSWDRSVDTALQQDIDMLTIYKMKAYANTVFFKKGVHAKEIALPSEEKEIEFMARALDKIDEAGFKRWSSFAFTKTGYVHKYVENTWRGKDLVAYGASAFGLIGDVNYQNSNDTATYCKKVDEGTMPVSRTYALTHKDLMVKELLLCPARLTSYRKSEFTGKFGFDYFDLIPQALTQLVDKGYITANKDELTLTKQGVLFSDYVGKVLAASIKDVLGKDGIGFIY
jgi:oxygen-independent coproporphyrinogen-3 oxidase